MKRANEALTPPLYKVGLVMLRNVHDDDPLVYLTQVKAKNPAEQQMVDFGLPKGTRRFWDNASRQWHDVTDDACALRQRASLEPMERTLMREAEEELGLAPQGFARLALHQLGERTHISRKGPAQSVDWFVAEAPASIAKSIRPQPKDAIATVCISFSDLRAMEEFGVMNPHYVTVAEEALAAMRQKTLKRAEFHSPALPTK